MEHDSFHTYMKDLYEKKKFDPLAYVPYPQRDDFDNFIEKIDYCSFLNQIPFSEWDENIIKIFKWAKLYYSPVIFKRQIGDARPVEIRNAHTKILKASEALLDEFIPKERRRTTNSYGTTFIDYEGMPKCNTNFIKNLHKLLQKAIDDIEEQKFEIFPREYYHGSRQAERQELRKLLKDIAQKYNISPYSDDINMLLQEI